MIEKYLVKSVLARKRWRIFKKNKSAVISVFILFFLVIGTALSGKNSSNLSFELDLYYYFH